MQEDAFVKARAGKGTPVDAVRGTGTEN